jgi:hypothetical protein
MLEPSSKLRRLSALMARVGIELDKMALRVARRTQGDTTFISRIASNQSISRTSLKPNGWSQEARTDIKFRI